MALDDDEFVVDFPALFVALDWIEEHCVIPDGFRKGSPFELLDWQAWCLANAYRLKPDAVWVPDNPVLAPNFVYRRSQIVLPQKSGKGPYTAARICCEGLGPSIFAGWAEEGDVYLCSEHGCPCGWYYEYEPGEAMGIPWPTPLIQVTAFSEEQAGNVYDAVRAMISEGPLSEVIPDNKNTNEFIRLPNSGRIDRVTANAQSRLGQRVTYVAQDETGIWTSSNKMEKVASTQRRGLAGMGGRSEETTNAWDPSERSVAQQTSESRTEDVFKFHPKAPDTLSFTNKQERRRLLRAVYRYSLRENGGHIDLDSIEAEAVELLEEKPAEAERFFGNRITAGTGSWLEPAAWAQRAVERREVPRGEMVVLGFDGSDMDDWTAIRAETADGYQFTPTYGPDNRPTIWNPEDYGGQVPRLEVSAAVEELMKRYKVVRMYCDPPYWDSEVDSWAEQFGERVVIRWYTRRPVQMHEAAERLKTDVLKADTPFTHDGDDITTRHVANARTAVRPGNRYILEKASQAQKIDACVTSIICHEAAGDVTAAKGWRKPKNRVYLASTTRR